MAWIKKHKILVISIFILLSLFLFAGIYIWSMLGLIQYENDEEPVSVITETHEEAQVENAVLENEPVVLQETVPDEPKESVEEAKEEPKEKNDEVINVLLLGTDERTKEFSDNARSDCMILASINTKTKSIKLVSLERGMGVPVLSGEYQGQYDWLTHIFRYGGAELVMNTVEECFEVEVDRYVRVNFNIFTQIIDSIGGIDISLSETEVAYMIEKGHKNVTVGVNHLNGKSALEYARMRKPDSDWERVKRQRNVITASITQVRENMSLIDANRIAKELLPLIKTNYTKVELAELLFVAPAFWNCSLEQMTLPVSGTYSNTIGMGGRSMFAVDFEENSKILNQFLYNENDIPDSDK